MKYSVAQSHEAEEIKRLSWKGHSTSRGKTNPNNSHCIAACCINTQLGELLYKWSTAKDVRRFSARLTRAKDLDPAMNFFD